MKILIITPYFPSPDIYSRLEDDPRTKFLLRYAVEWVKAGVDVHVLHLPLRYTKIFHWIASILRYTGYGIKLRRFIQNQSLFIEREYEFQGVNISRYPLTKLFPRQKRFPFQLKRVLSTFCSARNEGYNFIISDFFSPSLDAAMYVRNNFCSNASIWQIFHQSDMAYFESSPNFYIRRLDCVTGYLFRSKPSMRAFKEYLGVPDKPVSMIYSGVPVISGDVCVRSSIRKFIYVGTLRYSKNVHRTVEAFARCLKGTNSTLVVVGDGADREEIEKLVTDLGVREQVSFTGRLTRTDVFREMSNADCLVMVSAETFGMVYVEAMAHGCLVIAARGQGIDGVVVDGQNGFLVALDNPFELDDLILRLTNAPPEYIRRITSNAIATAAAMDDKTLARNVIRDIKRLSEDQR